MNKNTREKISIDKVFYDMCALALFGRRESYVIDKISKYNTCASSRIKPLFSQLVSEGKIAVVDGKVENRAKTAIGKVITKPGATFAHVKVGDKDIYVNDRGITVDGDTVEISFWTMFGKREGVITKIVKREHQELTGVVTKENKQYVFTPSNKKFDIPIALYGTNLDDSVDKKVKVSLIYADLEGMVDKINPIIAKVDKIYGKAGDKIVENIAIADKYGFSKEFPDYVYDESDKLPDDLCEKDKKGAVDLTKIPFCTIDPKGCKDIDDAIYVEKVSGGEGEYTAYVALADVAYYVKPGTKLDEEAYIRGTSCYLGDGVYPMLPEKLSNGICSLNPGENRRAIVGKITVDSVGKVVDYDFCEAIIKSAKKYSYDDAQQIVDGKKLCANQELKQSLKSAFELSEILTKMRKDRGAITINNPEATFSFNESGSRVDDVKEYSRIPATKVIESLMILFNEAVGDLADKNDFETLYRVHLKPGERGVEAICAACRDLGVAYNKDSTSKGINELLERVKGTPYEAYINHIVLTSMKKASYCETNLNHYALASENYIHSTAAIRRYNDIILQRALKKYLRGEKQNGSYDLCPQSYELSQRELDADMAERESDQYMKTLWAEEHKYVTYPASISSICKDGVYAMIDKKLVSVFIPIGSILEHGAKNCEPNLTKTCLFNKQKNRVLSVGDKLCIAITKTDLNTRTIIGEKVKQNENKFLNTATQFISNTNIEK